MSYEIRRYHPDHKTQVVDLLARAWWGTAAAARRVFEWKFEQNPYLPGPFGFVAIADGTVVGFRGVMGTRWQYGPDGQSTVIPCAENLVIEPGHRNLGVAQDLNQATLEALSMERYDYVINLTANATNFHMSVMRGWRPTARIEQMSWSATGRDPYWSTPGQNRGDPAGSTLAQGVQNRIKFTGAATRIWRAVNAMNKRRIVKKGPPELVVSDSATPSAMAELVARLPLDYRITHVRDEEYYRWRFEAHPPETRTHHRFLYWGESPMRGFLVLSWKRQPSSVKIADIAAADEHVFTQLLQAAKLSRFVRLETWTGTLKANERDTMLREGFRVFSSSRSMPSVLVRPTNDARVGQLWRLGGLDMLDLSNWNLSPLCAMGS